MLPTTWGKLQSITPQFHSNNLLFGIKLNEKAPQGAFLLTLFSKDIIICVMQQTMLNKHMKHFIYKTTHKNGKYYIGRHSTNNIDDGYIGSGKWPRSIKDKSTLTREILEYTKCR